MNYKWSTLLPESDGYLQGRVKRHFLLFPKSIKGHIKWFEWATWYEVNRGSDYMSDWNVIDWLPDEKWQNEKEE